MIKVENIDVWGFEHAIRGMRNPMNSWDKSDSYLQYGLDVKDEYVVGNNDLDLMKRLYRAGTEHRKYLRQIQVSLDITAPLYWWKEFDTYKVGTTSNSCSTMHKIHSKKFVLDDFSHDRLTEGAMLVLKDNIKALNLFREQYIKTKDKAYWWNMIQLLPTSYNQKRTITMNYENVMNIIKQRTGHRLDEWREFVEMLKELPYVKQITNIDNVGDWLEYTE